MARWAIIPVLLLTTAVASLSVVGVWAQFLASHDTSGEANTAEATTDVFYICRPSGTITNPQCPIDTDGADETIFAGNEGLLPGSVSWQKIRVTNVGTDPWDILSVARSWTEVSDPSGLCGTVPEAVTYLAGATTDAGNTGPGVTVLGINPSEDSGTLEPVEGVLYPSSFDDNHGSVAGTITFPNLENNIKTVHVEPGAYEDLLLGIRLPFDTPDDCLNVVWQLTTTWNMRIHNP